MCAQVVHSSPFSGSWYPGNRAELEGAISHLFAESIERTGEDLLPAAAGFVVPHAGLSYSGRVAASVYRHIRAMAPKLVVLLGFSHRGAPPGAWIPEVDKYETPLGETLVNAEARAQLLGSGQFGSMREELLCDHSVEIQLPLLTAACPDAKILPVYVSSLSEAARKMAAGALSKLHGPDMVMVASSDFTHYGHQFGHEPFPNDSMTPMNLHHLDAEFIEAAGTLDPRFFITTLNRRSATVCGREPIALLLETLNSLPGEEDYLQMELDYETSGDRTGDYSHCVSYAALGYFPWSSFQLSIDDQTLLLDSVKQTLQRYQESGLAVPVPPVRETVGTSRRAGAFVTIHQKGELRGCVGRVGTTMALHSSIPELTLSAALEDSRFKPLSPAETDLEVEISILSPMKRLPDPSCFRVNVDGAYLKIGGVGGLLLPQVADGRNWTGPDFLQALARKAGVTDDVYDDPAAKLYSFRAQIIQ